MYTLEQLNTLHQLTAGKVTLKAVRNGVSTCPSDDFKAMGSELWSKVMSYKNLNQFKKLMESFHELAVAEGKGVGTEDILVPPPSPSGPDTALAPPPAKAPEMTPDAAIHAICGDLMDTAADQPFIEGEEPDHHGQLLLNDGVSFELDQYSTFQSGIVHVREVIGYLVSQAISFAGKVSDEQALEISNAFNPLKREVGKLKKAVTLISPPVVKAIKPPKAVTPKLEPELSPKLTEVIGQMTTLLQQVSAIVDVPAMTPVEALVADEGAPPNTETEALALASRIFEKIEALLAYLIKAVPEMSDETKKLFSTRIGLIVGHSQIMTDCLIGKPV